MGPYVVLRCWVSGAAAVSVINELDIGCGKNRNAGRSINIISTPQWHHRCCHSCIFSFQEIFLPECADAKEDPPEKAGIAIATFQWGSEVAPLWHHITSTVAGSITGKFLVISCFQFFVRCRFYLCITAHQNAHGCLSEHSCTRAPWQGKPDWAGYQVTGFSG